MNKKLDIGGERKFFFRLVIEIMIEIKRLVVIVNGIESKNCIFKLFNSKRKNY